MRYITNSQSSIKIEEEYHDLVATFYSNRRLHDYIWEVPEEILLLNKKYFVSGTKVIDMGCGPAISVSRILGKSVLNRISYSGVDISRNMLTEAKKNIKKGRFILHDISTVPFFRSNYDVLLSLGALHHCEDKSATLERWLKVVRPGGHLLLREPLYEALKRGTGESPTEEGIKTNELFEFIATHNLKIERLVFFSTNAFHLFNRIMIKIGLRKWQNIRVFWYPVVIVDVLIAKLRKLSKLFEPQAIAIIIQKI